MNIIRGNIYLICVLFLVSNGDSFHPSDGNPPITYEKGTTTVSDGGMVIAYRNTLHHMADERDGDDDDGMPPFVDGGGQKKKKIITKE